MSRHPVGETFYRPEEIVATETTTLPASLHNGMRLLLAHAGGCTVFIPIRSMQYLAVLEPHEILFIDGQGGYACRDGEGGRLIQLVWQPLLSRESLFTPVFYRMVYYFKDLKGTQTRLLAEMGSAVQRMLDRAHGEGGAVRQARILPFPRPRS